MKYRCHEEVAAVKIASIEPYTAMKRQGETSIPVNGAMITPVAPYRYGPFFVTQEWVEEHHPDAGGYIVTHDDGRYSFVSADEFEKNYTEIHDSADRGWLFPLDVEGTA